MGLSVPTCSLNVSTSRATWLCTDGVSAAPSVVGPFPTDPPPPNASAYSQVPRGQLVDGEPGNVAGEHYMGYTVRQPGWRYTEWVAFDNTTGKGNWSNVVGVELYTHDLLAPNQPPPCTFGTEVVNVAQENQYQAVRQRLAAQLRTHFDVQR